MGAVPAAGLGHLLMVFWKGNPVSAVVLRNGRHVKPVVVTRLTVTRLTVEDRAEKKYT